MKTALTLKERIAAMDELKQVERRLRESVRSVSPVTDGLARHLLSRGGKRLRPLLVILSAAGAPCSGALLDTAAAAELIHTASLIHDDIIDESGQRRGTRSLNSRWGNKWAVLTGDFLFSRAYSLLIQYPSLEVLEPMTEAIALMCEGEIEQLDRIRHGRIPSEGEYCQYIFKKTAFFLSACCTAGARAGGLDEERIQALASFGYHLGMAFQIIDDVLDLMPGGQTLGKPTGSDIRSKVVTLPLLYLLQNPRHAPLVEELLKKQHISRDEVEDLSRAAHSSGSLQQAQKKAEEHVFQARENLAFLARHPQGDLLEQLALFVLKRDH